MRALSAILLASLLLSCAKKEDLTPVHNGTQGGFIINDFSPHAGETGIDIAISGNFNTQTSLKVKFNGEDALVKTVSASLVTATVPNRALTGRIVILNGNDVLTSPSEFTVLPRVDRLSALAGAIGSEVTIIGSGFDSRNKINVKLGGIHATIVATTPTSIVVMVPAGLSSGFFEVLVGETTTIASSKFTVLPFTLSSLESEGEDHADGYTIARDLVGNIYVAGSFLNQTSIGGVLLSSAGYSDAFVAKFDPTLQPLWVVRAGGPGNDVILSLVVDNAGDVYIGGNANAGATFGTLSVNTAYQNSLFVAKLSSSGEFLWLADAGSTGTIVPYVNRIAVDNKGYVYAAGHFGEDVYFGLNTRFESHAYPDTDIVLAKYTASGGTPVLVRTYGGLSYDSALGLAVDESGNVYVTGEFSSTIALGSTTLNSSGGFDAFVAKFDNLFNPVWANAISGTGQYDMARAVELSGTSLLVTGYFTGSAKFGSQQVSGAGLEDIFVAKYTLADGSLEWVKSAGGTNFDNGTDLTVLPNGDFFVTGYTAGDAKFDGTTIQSQDWDIFVARYTASGELSWVFNNGGADIDIGYGIASSENSVLLTGFVRKQSDHMIVWKLDY